MPYTPEYLRAASEGDTSAALLDLRLAARVQGAMVARYRYVQCVACAVRLRRTALLRRLPAAWCMQSMLCWLRNLGRQDNKACWW